MASFEETMENSRIFLTYSLALTILSKSAQILAERGANPKAMSFITTGISLLTQQLRDYTDNKKNQENANDPSDASFCEEIEKQMSELDKELDGLCKGLKINRSDGSR